MIPVTIVIAVLCIFTQDITAKPPAKIVGGDDATIDEFPWIVSIRSKGQHICGGSLISNKHILTAAHCFKVINPFEPDYGSVADASTITVQIGNTAIGGDKNVHTVAEVYAHDLFWDRYVQPWSYDIAILTLKDPIIPNEYQQPIALPTTDSKVGQIGKVAGWGKTAEFSTTPSKTLKKALMEILDDQTCKSFASYYSSRSLFCAANGPNVGFCNGDSGGPFVIDNKVVGVVSNSQACSGPTPYLYTRVFNFLDWINNILNAESSA